MNASPLDNLRDSKTRVAWEMRMRKRFTFKVIFDVLPPDLDKQYFPKDECIGIDESLWKLSNFFDLMDIDLQDLH